MRQDVIIGIALVIGLGVGAQWLAWRLRLPSILLLLLVGFLAGPVLGVLDPDALLGDGLLPLVSVAVAVILYEGGLSLKFQELRQAGSVVWRLVTVGALATWLIGAAAARFFFGLPLEVAVLLGAVLVVTGPTVIGPLLRHIRPTGATGSILKWEGIVIDPIGAILAVLVYEAIFIADVQEATEFAALAVGKTVVLGGGLGVLAAALLALLLRWYWMPDFLDNAASLALALGVYAISEQIQKESGLFAATVMGVALANQRIADIRHIVEFKEHLRTLLIAALFVVLSARLEMETLAALGLGSVGFVLTLILLGRPISVIVSTMPAKLSWRERGFLTWMAPRGIVAAAVASVFSLELQAAGRDEASLIVPVTFAVIVGTVAVYGLTAGWAARWLGVAEPNPQGVLFVGASEWARAVGERLKAEGLRILMVDTNRSSIAAARMKGIDTHQDNVLSEELLDNINLGGLGKLVAATPNDWVNALAVQRFLRIFGRANVFQVRPAEEGRDAEEVVGGRVLFREGVTHRELNRRLGAGAEVRATPLSEEFTIKNFREMHGDEAVVLFYLTPDKRLVPSTGRETAKPEPGWKVISLVNESKAQEAGEKSGAGASAARS